MSSSFLRLRGRTMTAAAVLRGSSTSTIGILNRKIFFPPPSSSSSSSNSLFFTPASGGGGRRQSFMTSSYTMNNNSTSRASTMMQNMQLVQLKRLVDTDPSNEAIVYAFYRALNQGGYGHLVPQYYEMGTYASSERIRQEYARGLRGGGGGTSSSLDNDAYYQPQMYNTNTNASQSQMPRDYDREQVRQFTKSITDKYLPDGGGSGNVTINVNGGTEDRSQKIMRYLSFGFGAVLTVAILAMLFSGPKGLGALGQDMGDKEMKTDVNERFEDVIGCDEARDELREVIQFLRNPATFEKLGGRLPKGVLLIGPPGTGKTLLAKAVAGEAGVPFFSMSGSEFEEVFVGLGAKRIRDLFAAARKKAPCVIFIDEIDSVGGKRKTSASPSGYSLRGTVNQLLSEMDGFGSAEGIIVIAATNAVDELDDALIRPGRFDKQVVVPPPDVQGRTELFKHYLDKIRRRADIDPTRLARSTTGATGAVIRQIVNEAAVRAATLGKDAVEWGDLEWASDKVQIGTERKLVMDDDEKRKTAYHEGGHTLVGLLTPGAYPLHKVTILPRGPALGITFQLPTKDVYSMTKEQIFAQMDVCMGGRVAEELKFGLDKVGTGASNDFQKATQMARGMVTQWGMNEKLGYQVFPDERSLSLASSETRSLIESEVKRLLDESYARTKHLLTTHMKELDVIADQLLVKETLTAEQVDEVLKALRLNKSTTVAAAAASSSVPAAAGSSNSSSGRTQQPQYSFQQPQPTAVAAAVVTASDKNVVA